MFNRVLIANRGEIACRVLRTLRRLGVPSVAVYHWEDRLAPHVADADLAIQLTGESPGAAYQDQDQIIRIARETQSAAVHPGYGFLSENPTFAQRVTDAGLVFIGPDAQAMRLMGDKLRAREFALRHEVPVAPGIVQTGDLQEFARKAGALGFPLLIKAAAGGGGKGMRVVRNTAELESGAQVAAAEAQRYFGDARIYAERLIDKPRHIEVQVLGDGEGKVIHLGERECSIQRRYQKIVEESPAPRLEAGLREAICEAAVRLATAAHYKNAGTVEFVVAPDGEFYFLEMNTRLQVEHPVTECVLGMDLVEAQLRIASGEGLPLSQGDVKPEGHAIECRICAEEPYQDFRPAIGCIGLLRLPAGPGIRFDGGIREGQAVTPSFDSMLAKLIAFGATREEARERAVAALGDLVILGVATNIEFLTRVLASPAFREGRLSTAFVTDYASQLRPDPISSETQHAAVLAGALADADFRRIAFDVPEPYASIGAWRN